MRAKVVPYSSVVGSSVILFEQEGAPIVAQLALLNVGGDKENPHARQEPFRRTAARNHRLAP